MRHYELVTILSPMLSQDQATEAWGQINDFITNRNGDIFQEQPWGTRRLAYPIQQGSHHFLEGNYRLIRFSTEAPFNQALESFLKFDERVLRSLVLSIPKREILPDPAASRPAPVAATATRPAEEGEAAAAPAEGSATGDAPVAVAETAEAPAAEAEASPAEATEAVAEAPAEEAAAEPVAEAATETEAVSETETETVSESVVEAESEAPPVETVAEAGETPTAEAETPAEAQEAPAEETPAEQAPAEQASSEEEQSKA